jgi:hypothetical protein
MRMKRYSDAVTLANRAGPLGYDLFLKHAEGYFGRNDGEDGSVSGCTRNSGPSLNYDASAYAVRDINERIDRCEFLEQWR